MEPKIGDIVIVKEDIYIDYFLIPEGNYEVAGYQKTGAVSITEDDDEGEERILEDWRGDLVKLQLKDGEGYYVEWWIPFRKDVCDFYKVPKRELQLSFSF